MEITIIMYCMLCLTCLAIVFTVQWEIHRLRPRKKLTRVSGMIRLRVKETWFAQILNSLNLMSQMNMDMDQKTKDLREYLDEIRKEYIKITPPKEVN